MANNLFDQAPFALRGENDARIAAIDTRLVALEADSGWIVPTLLNGWVSWDTGGTFGPAAYRKIGGVVYMRGLIKDGTITAGTSILTLPVGFRPILIRHVLATISNSAICRLDMMSDGNLKIEFGASATWISLSNIFFVADA